MCGIFLRLKHNLTSSVNIDSQSHENVFHFFKIIELTVAQACWAICLVAIDAEVGILVASDNSLASEALGGDVFGILNDHLVVFSSEHLLHEDGHLIFLDSSTLVLVNFIEDSVVIVDGESVGVSKVTESLLDETAGLVSVEMAIVVDVELIPDRINICVNLFLGNLLIIEGARSTTLSVLFYTLWLDAEAKTFNLSSVENEFVSQLIDDVERIDLNLFDIEVLDALMSVEFTSWVLLVADLAHDHDFWTVALDVIVELRSGHVLELRSVADVATELRAVELGVSLKFSESLPDDFSTISVAFVRELTEINTVSDDLVDFLEEVTSGLTIGAANIEVSWSSVGHLTIGIASSISTGRHQLVINLLLKVIPLWLFVHLALVIARVSLLELKLAVFAEKLVAAPALKRLEWELTTHGALNFFNHLSLKLILDFVHLNIESWDRLWTHQLLDDFIRDDEIQSLLDREAIVFFGIHLLENRKISSLLLS